MYGLNTLLVGRHLQATSEVDLWDSPKDYLEHKIVPRSTPRQHCANLPTDWCLGLHVVLPSKTGSLVL